jgi:hypothetical protein
MRLTTLCLAATGLAACARPAGTPVEVTDVSVRFGADVTRTIPVARGQTYVLDVFVERPDGSPVDVYDFRVESYGFNYGLVQSMRVEPGHEQVSFSAPDRDGGTTYFNVSVCPDEEYYGCGGGVRFRSRPVRLSVYGGAPASSMFVGELDLSVGEVRPVRVVGMVAPSETRERPSPVAAHDPPSFVVADGRVLAVDERGVFEGLSAGTTEVSITVAGYTESFPVTVYDPAERPLRRLENEVVRIGGAPQVLSYGRPFVPRGSVLEAIVADGDGDPVVLVEHAISAEVDKKQYLLTRWTGTGWGAEAPFPPWVTAMFPVVVKDEDGVLYVGAAHVEDGTYVIATRHVDAIGEPFELHELPLPSFVDPDDPITGTSPLRIRRGGGLDPASIDARSDWISLFPRQGGGVHFGYTPSYGLDAATCARALIVGTFDGQRFEHEQREDVRWLLEGAGCDWTAPVGEIHWKADRLNGEVPKLDASRYRAEPRSEAWMSREVDGAPAPGIEVSRLGGDLPWSYRFDDGERVYTVGDAPGYTSIDAMGSTVQDFPQHYYFESDFVDPIRTANEAYTAALGHAGSTAFAVVEGVGEGPPLFLAWTPPPPPPILGAETSEHGLAGLRIEAAADPEPVSALVVLPNGRRFVLLERMRHLEPRFTAPAIARSDGPDAPWEQVQQRDLEVFELADDLKALGSTLYGVGRRYGANDADVHFYTSVDDGASWQSRGITLDAEYTASAAQLFPDGHREVTFYRALSRELSVHRALDLGPFGRAAWAVPSGYLRWNEGTVAYVASDAPDAEADVAGRTLRLGIATQSAGSSWVYALVAVELDEDGSELASHVIPCPPGLRLKNAVRLPDGDLVLFAGVSGELHDPPTLAARVDWASQTVETSPLSDTVFRARSRIVRMADGTLVAGVEHFAPHGANERVLAAYVTSTDGLTWTEPVPLRPAGGRGQVVYAVAAEGPDELLFVIGDGGALTQDISWGTSYRELGAVGGLTPRMVPMSVRVRL